MQYSRIFEPGRLAKALLVSVVLCVSATTAADAARRHRVHHPNATSARSDDDGGITTSARYAAYVVDDKSGRVLYARNQDELRHPASLTKMMTLYLLFEELSKKRMSLSTPLTASAHGAAQAPSKLGLRPGQTITVEDAIRALVTKSANDVAVTIAENVGGSEDAFARRMTATARRIGMSRTTFRNASGLPNPDQWTTAHDMVTLGRALQERFPAYYRYFSTRSFAWGNAVHGNHNKLLYRLDGIDGIKTGYTDASGFNLVSSLRRDDRHLVAAVLGGSSGRQRDDHMAALLSRYIGAAAPGAKASYALAPGRSADASDDVGDDDAPAGVAAYAAPAAPMPAAVAPPPAEPARLAEAAAPPPAPTSEAARQPRIARSEVVPIERSGVERRASDDRGAAVAMARAILLPQTARPSPAPTPEPVRTAAAPAPEARAPSLADATVSLTDVQELTTASVPRRKSETAPAPTPVAAAPAPSAAAAAARSGWLVQIGAFDGEAAARDALDKARDKVGGPLARADGYTETIGGGSSRLWRARFAGFKDQSAADDACKALQRKKVTCLAMRQ